MQFIASNNSHVLSICSYASSAVLGPNFSVDEAYIEIHNSTHIEKIPIDVCFSLINKFGFQIWRHVSVFFTCALFEPELRACVRLYRLYEKYDEGLISDEGIISCLELIYSSWSNSTSQPCPRQFTLAGTIVMWVIISYVWATSLYFVYHYWISTLGDILRYTKSVMIKTLYLKSSAIYLHEGFQSCASRAHTHRYGDNNNLSVYSYTYIFEINHLTHCSKSEREFIERLCLLIRYIDGWWIT